LRPVLCAQLAAADRPSPARPRRGRRRAALDLAPARADDGRRDGGHPARRRDGPGADAAVRVDRAGGSRGAVQPGALPERDEGRWDNGDAAADHLAYPVQPDLLENLAALGPLLV